MYLLFYLLGFLLGFLMAKFLCEEVIKKQQVEITNLAIENNIYKCKEDFKND